MSEENINFDDEFITLGKREYQSLLSKVHSMRSIKEQFDDELEMAARIQTLLLPQDLPKFIDGYVSTKYIPSEKVGGDLFDIIETKRHKLAILIFDVSGHGIPAAFISAMAKLLFKRYIERFDSPAEIFDHVNRGLLETVKSEHYLTAFLGIIDPFLNEMVYSSAGHVKPLLYRSEQERVEELDAKGLFIGHEALSSVVFYNNRHVKLSPHDKLLIYTDGLTEGVNRKKEMYGFERLVDIYKKVASEHTSNIVESIFADQTRFRDGVSLTDDVTMVVLEIKNTSHIVNDTGFVANDDPSVYVVRNEDDIDEFSYLLLKKADILGYSDTIIKKMKYVAFELLSNAIEHGNEFDEKKKVLIFYKITDDKFQLSVVDDGKGFDYSTLKDPIVLNSLYKRRGRGLRIVKSFTDSISFNQKGNRVYVEIYNK